MKKKNKTGSDGDIMRAMGSDGHPEADMNAEQDEDDSEG